MKNEVSFEYIAKDILENKKFQKISTESHHGITRMEHSLRVARFVYKIAKKLNLDYVSATRAAILHDFFTNKEFGSHHGLIQGVVHPDIALSNAKGEFDINDIEANAIEAHMFPLSKVVPKYRESWVLTAVDKGVAIYEQALYKFNYKKVTSKINYSISLIGILAFNILTMEHK
ncbi:MAG: HD domain-containing protein [Bacilli bacterium]|nr:HD domain-containing protein [Bacilli bacterium]